MFTLRPYQKAASDATVCGKTEGVIVIPTGGGKSLVIADIVQRLPGHTLVFQPSKEILEQNYSKLLSYGFRDAAIFSASCNSKEIAKATYATIGSAINRIEDFRHFDNVIIDECDLTNPKGGQYKDFIDFVGARKLVGLTATPYRLYSSSFGAQLRVIVRTRPKIFTHVLHVTQIGELYDSGFLCPIEVKNRGDFDRTKVRRNSTGADYDDRSLKVYLTASRIENDTVDAVRDALDSGRKHVLVFTKFLSETDKVIKRLSGFGITAERVEGRTPKILREKRILGFRKGQIKVIVNVGTMTVGFDFPELDAIIVARPTMSLRLHYQMCGRGIRPHSSKESVVVYDLCGNFDAFGKIEDLKFVPDSRGLYDCYNRDGRVTAKFYDDAPDSKVRFEFGKQYRGKVLGEVPTDYLEWFAENVKRNTYRANVLGELTRRKLFPTNGETRNAEIPS